MIPIKIKKEKYNLKSFDEINVKEYKRIIDSISDNKEFNLIDYMRIMLGIDEKEVKKYRIAPNTKFLTGELFNYKEEKVNEKFVLEGEEFIVDQYDTMTLGKRHSIENYAKTEPHNIDAIAYVLAVAIDDTDNLPDIQDYHKKILNCNAKEILPIAHFFFLNFKRGLANERKGLRRYLSMIKTLILKRLLKWKG